LSRTSWDEPYSLTKRRIDAHSRSAIPIFRGSNLGLFLRKRPFTVLPEHSVTQRQAIRSLTNDGEDDLPAFSDNIEQFQRRFDDYSENPGPMFGR
jgi:hypothetical protein